MSGAWAKGANKAVVNAPSSGRIDRGDGSNNNNRRNFNNNNNTGDGGDNSGRGGRGRGRGGGRGAGRGRGRNNFDNGNGGRGGRGRGRNNYDSNNKNNRRGGQDNNGSNHQRIIIKDVQLLNATGNGSTPAQQAVKRISAKILMMARTKYIEAPAPDANGVEVFKPHPECLWTDDDRAEIINQSSMRVMELGDVSKNPNAKSKNKETAPPLGECKPLQVNEETRWKSKAMKISSSSGTPESTNEDEEISIATLMNKGLLILNKISLTTMDRLTKQFVEETNLVENDKVREDIIMMLIRKAQTEQHFGPMYAQLCSIIGKEFKPFKKDLLEKCQGEFEMETADKIALATKTADGIPPMDEEEIQYHSTLIRKAYVGHIKFLGELYLRDVVKLSVMTYCLDELLKDESNEENLECFAHLMTTMGEKLLGHTKKKNNKPFDWGPVETLRKSPNISNRIKFLLQDLFELKDRGWVQRRKLETAKSIADLHKEVAKEEKNQRRNGSMSISTSKSNLRRVSSLAAAAPSMDNDGFMAISRASMKKVGSKQNISTGTETASALPSISKGKLRRAQSTPGGMSTSFTIGTPSSTPIKQKNITSNSMSNAPSLPATVSPERSSALSAEQCESKMKSIMKEYFVGGDTADAVLSVHEMIQVASEGSIERGAKAFGAGVLMVMEMKEANVKQLLTVLESCVKDSKIEKEAIVQGLNDPLEFLRDVQIDAPLAASHLSLIIFELINWNATSLDFLLGAPEYFRTDGKPAAFAIEILKKKNGVGPSDDDLVVVESLMTDGDKKVHSSAKAMFDAL